MSSPRTGSHAPVSPRRRLLSTASLVAAVCVLAVGLALPRDAATASAPHVVAQAPAGKTFTVHAERQFTKPSAEDPTVFETTTAASYDISMMVSATTNLRSRQEIEVSWTGAHPTGGVATDSNYGVSGSEQEYPFVLMQCRGTGAEVTPQTCWTQSSRERFVSDASSTVPATWRVDAAASAADRAPVVGAPDPRPATCSAPARSERWLPFVAADGTTYYGGSGLASAKSCADFAPGSSDQVPNGVPNQTTYGITNTAGNGSSSFDVWTSDDSSNLGCTATVACSLVAVPIVGLSCDGWFTRAPEAMPATLTDRNKAVAQRNCEATGAYAAGEPLNYNAKVSSIAVSGQLWWSASNWANRIVVPLSFAPDASVCSTSGAADPLLVYGSVLMSEVSAQWQPTFCTTKGLEPFVHVQTSDAAARTLINGGGISMALGSRAPDDPFLRPVVQAPVAVTGWGIAYAIDGADGQPYTQLKLNARLIAKLLSQSYPGDSQLRTSRTYQAIADNPRTIAEDPEFRALNPDLPDTVNSAATNSAAALIALSSDADLTYALSSYVDADPEARKWLDGVPDPWGMSVNPWYKDIELPVESWPLSDPWELTDSHDPCYEASPAPYLGLIANPNSLVSSIVTHVQFGIPNDQTVCVGADTLDPRLYKLTTPGRLTPGTRFVLGVVPLTAAHRFGLDVAALQTTSDVDLTSQFTDTTGRTFVAPDSPGLKAAADLLEPDADAGVWHLDYGVFHDAEGAAGYPGTVPVYADVPLEGLSNDTAARAAQYLDYAAGPGQVPGAAIGQLPDGALPLTKANGLGELVAYTQCAADAVRDQGGAVPPVGEECPGDEPTDDPTGDPTDDPTDEPTDTTTTPGTDTPVVPTTTDVTPPAGDTPPPPKRTDGTPMPIADEPTTEAVRTVGQSTALGALGLPAALVLALALAIVGLVSRWGHVMRQAAAVGLPVVRRHAGDLVRKVRR